MKTYIFIFISLFLLVSCKNYYETIQDYHTDLDNGNYNAAQKKLENNKFFKKSRNEILYNLELGKTLHLQGKYDSSNIFFNKADLLMEDYMKTTMTDIGAQMRLNPGRAKYRGEHLERLLIHYYKALNYLYLNNNEDALVEAKRINIKLNTLEEKRKISFSADNNSFSAGNNYKSDAFAHTLEGIIYEKMNEFDEAFISYKTAIELYESNTGNQYLGTTLPPQLIVDIINVANKAGNYAERDLYCNRYNLNFEAIKDTSNYQVLFFWENGRVPIKKQEQIVLTMVKGVGGLVSFNNQENNINIPVILPSADMNRLALSNLKVIKYAFSRFVNIDSYYNSLSIQNDNSLVYYPSLAENISFIEKRSLRDRTIQDISVFVATQVAKKLVEIKAAEEAERIAKANASKNGKQYTPQKVTGILMAVTNGLSFAKQADTRNWQSLPSNISYVRLPAKKGENILIVKLMRLDNVSYTDTIDVNVKSRLTLLNYTTLKHLPIDFRLNLPFN